MLQYWLGYGEVYRIYYAGFTGRCGNYLHLPCADSGRLSIGYVDRYRRCTGKQGKNMQQTTA